MEEESTLQSLPEINKAAEKPDQESSMGCLYLPPLIISSFPRN